MNEFTKGSYEPDARDGDFTDLFGWVHFDLDDCRRVPDFETHEADNLARNDINIIESVRHFVESYRSQLIINKKFLC